MVMMMTVVLVVVVVAVLVLVIRFVAGVGNVVEEAFMNCINNIEPCTPTR